MADNIKLVFTYTIAAILILGGLFILYQTRLDPPDQVADLKLIVSGFVGSAVTFVFYREAQTSTARQVERTYTNAAATQPTTTVTSGPPATATVSPQRVIDEDPPIEPDGLS